MTKLHRTELVSATKAFGVGCILILGNACGSSVAAAPKASVTYINPLQFSYSHWDHHLLQWLPDHPRYEMVEALMRDGEPSVVFLFLTQREAVAGSKKQYCYTNDAALAEQLAWAAGDRATQRVDIAYTPSSDSTLEQYQLEAETLDGKLTWDFMPASATSREYAAGLIDAVGAAHDLKSGLLVFDLPETAVAANGTQLTLGGAVYAAQPWPEISVPPYFQAYHAVHSRDVHDGYFPAASALTFEFSSVPSVLGPNATYRMRQTSDVQSRPIDSVVRVSAFDADSTTLELGSNLRAELVRQDGALLTRSLTMSDGAAQMQVRFEPPLPDLRNMPEGSTHSTFGVSISGQGEVVSGGVTVDRTLNAAELLLSPASPIWTQKIQLRTHIDFTDDGYIYAAHTVYPSTDGHE